MLDAASLRQRILERCEWRPGPLSTPCLIWTGALHGAPPNNYGKIRHQGKSLKVHRTIWVAEYGEIEKGLEVCHHCDRPPCCEIQHLYVGTHARNMGDAARRHRIVNVWQGEDHVCALLTDIQVSHIKYFLQHGWTGAQLARRYPVGRSLISKIKRGRHWSHIQPIQPVDGEPLPVPPPLNVSKAEIDALFASILQPNANLERSQANGRSPLQGTSRREYSRSQDRIAPQTKRRRGLR
jgi:hypothetical protein